MVVYVRSLLVLAVLLAGIGAQGTASAATRTVEATVRCSPNASNPTVETTVTNRAVADLRVILVRALAHPGSIFPIGSAEQTLLPGESFKASVRRAVPSATDDGALIVTSIGVLRVRCGTTGKLTVDNQATTANERIEADIIAAAETLGQVEAGYDFDALYRLLHPDARDVVSFEALGCWYIDEYAPLTTPGEVTVTDVRMVEWTWGVNGETYDSAEVDYEQRFETGSGGPDGPQVEIKEGTAHFAYDEGQWRWFFGGSQEFLDGLRTDCGVGFSE